ncbi:MAG: glycerophosphodiester phosphodiesterase, partial [Amphibacillus sp.]|nr:glycerophosphodiester phosphodiesterase [Amphibacillus sp.]
MVVIIIIPLIIAHRGASYYRPENTMSAFQLAYDQHADGIETDIHLTKDQVPVLIHDKTINRITNEHGPVNQWNFKDLKQLDIGSWFNSEFKEERIVSLEQLLQWAQAKDILIN